MSIFVFIVHSFDLHASLPMVVLRLGFRWELDDGDDRRLSALRPAALLVNFWSGLLFNFDFIFRLLYDFEVD